MANENVNKVIVNGSILIDLTNDTVTASDVVSGKTFHLKSGASSTGTAPNPSLTTATASDILNGKKAITSDGLITGTSTFDADTSDATAAASEILATKTAYADGIKLTGTMTNNGSVTGTISAKTDQYTIPQGYHDGGGKVGIASSEQAKIIADNIRENVTILGVTGTMSGSEGVTPQEKTVTPSFITQSILPDTPTYNYLSSVTVNPIPVAYADNSAGGRTCTVG